MVTHPGDYQYKLQQLRQKINFMHRNIIESDPVISQSTSTCHLHIRSCMLLKLDRFQIKTPDQPNLKMFSFDIRLGLTTLKGDCWTYL